MAQARTKNENQTFRFQFDIDPANAEAFNMLMVHCGARTRAELFNNAVTLFEWAVEEVRSGRKIASVGDDDDVRIVLLPALETARRTASRFEEDATALTGQSGREAPPIASTKKAAAARDVVERTRRAAVNGPSAKQRA